LQRNELELNEKNCVLKKYKNGKYSNAINSDKKNLEALAEKAACDENMNQSVLYIECKSA